MDEYWRYRIDCGLLADTLKRLLKDGGYNNIPDDYSLEQLQLQHLRMRKLMLNYHACTNAELLRFIRQRSSTEGTKPILERKRLFNRRQMIETLQEEDEKQTFNRFLDLPNELQSLVAAFYMDFDHSLETPTQPPLARTSKHLRALALPIFYGTRCFVLEYVEYGQDTKVAVRLEMLSRAWLSSLSEGAVACIRSLNLMLPGVFEAVIETEKTGKGYDQLVFGEDGLDELEEDERFFERQRTELRRELSAMLEKVGWVDGLRRFQKRDIHAMRPAIEAALNRAEVDSEAEE